MKTLFRSHHAWLILCVPGTFALGTASADPTTADTSGWTCKLCPFLVGYETQSEAGVLYANGANATFGRYSGIDHSGAYADVAASGQLRSEDGDYASYDLERLGLASRDGHVEGGREGRYDVRVSYDGQPTRLYDTGATPFRANGNNLELPQGWVPAGSTSGMSALSGNLAPVRIESDRRTATLLARYFASPSWTLFGQYRREEKNGTDLTSASFLTQAVQFPQPFGYVTNSFDAGAAWAGRKASFRLTYTGSWFADSTDATNFANPYLPIVPGSTAGQLGTPPGNTLQQLAATGNVQLPWFLTTITYAASLGSLRQDESFVPASTLVGTNALTPNSLDGDVRLSHYALGLASRPLQKLSVRGNATYDGRDDRTTPQSVAYIVTDTFPGGTVITPRYSEDRVRLDGGADYALAHWIRVGVGGKFNGDHFGPGQVYTYTQETQSWGRVTLTPLESLSFTLKSGNGLRKVSSFNTAALPLAESPLVRDYNYAPRDRVSSTLTAAWAATSKLAVTLEGFLAKDDYRSSPLGLQGVHEQRASTTITWTPRDTLSAYVNAGYQRLLISQNGYTGIATTPWLATDTERFWNAGVGGRWAPQERWALTLDYLHSPSSSDTATTSGGLQEAFPQNSTQLDSTRLDVLYKWTAALQVHFVFTHESYHSSDWALGSVGPATVPNLLALGLQPYRDNVNVFGITARYQFGHGKNAAPESQ